MPRRVLRAVLFGTFEGPECQKHSSEHSLGDSEPGAQITRKALSGALSGPGTPVDGGWDRNLCLLVLEPGTDQAK